MLQKQKATKPNSKSAQRDDQYIKRRHACENLVRSEFDKKGGIIRRTTPHYMVVGQSSWLSTWYDNSTCLRIPIEEFDTRSISFTYGDSMPTFHPSLNDGKEYRKKVYTFAEILRLIRRYGLPQEWNQDGRYGPERYIEAHIWSDEPIEKYRKLYELETKELQFYSLL